MLTKTLRSVIIFGEWLCQFSQMELAEAIPSDPMLCNEQAPGSATGAMDEAGAVQNSGYESPSSGTSTEDAVLLRQKKICGNLKYFIDADPCRNSGTNMGYFCVVCRCVFNYSRNIQPSSKIRGSLVHACQFCALCGSELYPAAADSWPKMVKVNDEVLTSRMIRFRNSKDLKYKMRLYQTDVLQYAQGACEHKASGQWDGLDIAAPAETSRPTVAAAAGTSGGQKLRLRGLGVPASGSLPAGETQVVSGALDPGGVLRGGGWPRSPWLRPAAHWRASVRLAKQRSQSTVADTSDCRGYTRARALSADALPCA